MATSSFDLASPKPAHIMCRSGSPRIRRRPKNTPAALTMTAAILLCSTTAFQHKHNILLPRPSRPPSHLAPLSFADDSNNVDASTSSLSPLGFAANDNKGRNRRKKGGAGSNSKKKKNRRKLQSKTHSNNMMETDRTVVERYTWLRRVTKNLLDGELFPPGSLVKGKWHELSSMMLAWSRFVKDGTFDRVLELLASQQNKQQDKQGQLTVDGTNRLTPAVIIEGLLKRIIDEQEAGNTDVVVTVDLYNMAIEAWAAAAGRSGRKGSGGGADDEDDRHAIATGSVGRGTSQTLAAARRAADIVRSLQAAYEVSGNETLRPNSRSFLDALGAFTRAASYTSTPSSARDRATAAKEAESLLLWMEDLDKSGKNQDAAPGTVAYSLAMDAYAKSGHMDAGRKAEAIFRRLESAYMLEMESTSRKDDKRERQAGRKTAPNKFCYNILINAYSRQGRQGGVFDSAERILTEMEQRFEETSDEAIRPDVVSYSSTISAMARADRKGYGAIRAEDILNRMEAAGIVPNSITFNSCLKCWARSHDERAPARAEALVRRMEELDKAGNVNVRPDRISFNTLIHTFANAGSVKMAQHAEAILSRMENFAEEGNTDLSPNLFSWNSCIEAWSKANVSYSAEKAYSILRRLILLQRDGKSEVHPNKFSFNTVILALSRSSAPEAAVRAEELLGLMEKATASGIPDVQPDLYSYSSVISAWSRSGKQGAGKRAEQILERMEQLSQSGKPHLKPNSVSFNAAIDAWAKSGEGTLGARRAEQLLHRMEDLYAAGDQRAKPTANSYNAVLSAWARSGTKCAYWKAEELVNKMFERYESGESDVRPDHCSFNTLINAISKSEREGKAEKALRVLRRMDKLYQGGYKYARPNEMTYTSVLNSCAFTFVENDLSKRKALDVAIFTLEELQESHYGSPNHVTYGMFLKACAHLMTNDDERWQRIVEPVVRQCRRDGCVGELVLKQLQNSAPEHLYQNLLDDFVVDRDKMTVIKFSDLPEDWRCNVREKRGRTQWKGRRLGQSSPARVSAAANAAAARGRRTTANLRVVKKLQP